MLNASAWYKDADASRSRLLQYVHDGNTADALTKDIETAVRDANEDASWRRHAMGFMTLEQELMAREYAGHESGLAEGLAEGEAKGREAGLAEGESRYSELISILLSENRLDDLKRAADDADYRHALFEEYGI